jgi:hypothetical protein
MARYYFDVLDGDFSADDEGVDLSDARAALAEALQSLPDMAKDCLSAEGQREIRITVRDEAQKPLYEATLTISARRVSGAS